MTKILLISDSHGRASAIADVIREEKPDAVFFLGDCVPDMTEAAREFPGLDVRCVRGNCDAPFAAPEKLITSVDGVEIFAAHGDAYGVNTGLLRLALAAREADCAAAFFGHTHRSCRSVDGGVMLVNPGTLTDGSYAVLEADCGRLCVVK